MAACILCECLSVWWQSCLNSKVTDAQKTRSLIDGLWVCDTCLRLWFDILFESWFESKSYLNILLAYFSIDSAKFLVIPNTFFRAPVLHVHAYKQFSIHKAPFIVNIDAVAFGASLVVFDWVHAPGHTLKEVLHKHGSDPPPSLSLSFLWIT